MTLSGAASAAATADASGNFTFSSLVNGTYTLTPTKSGTVFTPASQSVTVSGAPITGLTFTAQTQTQSWSVSGAISPAALGSGTTVTLSGAASATATADTSGNFTFSSLANGTYIITPTKSGTVFAPGSQSVTVNGAPLTGVNFTAQAQGSNVTMSLGSGGAAAGGSVSLNVSLTSGGARPASTQWTMTYSPSVVATVSVAAGASATAAGKSVSCSSVSGSTTCVAFGMNANLMSDGVLATATFNIASGAAAGTSSVGITGTQASDASGNAISASGAGGTISVTTQTIISSLSCNPASVTAPGTSACTVALSAPATGGGFGITLASNNSSVTLPASLTVPAGSQSAGFTASVATIATNQTASLTASAGGVTKTFSLSLVAPGWRITGTITPASSGSGTTVALSGAASATATADSSGNFTFSGLANGAYTLTPTKSGNTFTPTNRTVTVSGADVTGVAFTAQTQTSASPVIDLQVFADQPGQSTSVNSPGFSTASGNELLLAFVAADDTGGQHITVTGVIGGGLTWVRAARTNVQRGTSEIWRAFAPQPLVNASVIATLSKSSTASITVMSFVGVDTSGTNGSGAIGAVGSGNAASGAPSAALVTTRSNSLVLGVGNDPAKALARTSGSGQTLVHQYLSPDGNTYWVQKASSAIAASGTSVTINDTAPTGDAYNLAISEILGPVSGGGQVSSIMTEAQALPRVNVKDDSHARNASPPRGAPVSLVNTATGEAGQVCSPGGLATLLGPGVAGDVPQSASSVPLAGRFPLPERLAGLQVKVNGVPAPLLFAAESQVNFQCPLVSQGSALEITLETANGASITPIQGTMQAAAPGVFTLSGTNQGVIQIANTHEIAMTETGGIPSRPARQGDYLAIYASGLGDVTDGVPVGTPAPLDRLAPVKNRISVVIGNVETDASFAGLAPGTVGLFQVNTRIPETVETGAAVPLYLKVRLPDGTVFESNRVTLAIGGGTIQ